jgi:hypothetical protein
MKNEEKNNEMMKKEEENKKPEAKKILNNFAFRLGTHKCVGKGIEKEKIDLKEQGRGGNGERDDKMKKKT